MRGEAAKRIGHLYPKARLPDGSEATVIARLWARTVASPNPASDGAHVPLANSFVLSSKKGREAIVVPVVENGGYRFTVSERKGSPFQSRDEPEGRALGQVRRPPPPGRAFRRPLPGRCGWTGRVVHGPRCSVQGIDLDDPADVLTRVAPGEGPPRWAAAVAQAPGRAVLGDEAGQLRSGPPAHLAREAAHHSLVGLAQLPVPDVWATNS